MPSGDPTPEEDEHSAIEDAAGEQLGVGRWDRPLIFRETAAAAVDNDLPYWAILILSGAIATLGLAMNSSAVVIGAMLVAPLLAPIVGLSLALAMGDGRLALQTGAVVLASTLAVILTAALLTELLPFQSITLEISSRIRPTALDLGIAICSGLVGAVVTVARGHRLSAAIPGVAIAVALIPPLGVAGFGMAAGWQRDIIGGSLLLFSANLAGIVLSAVGLFLLIGMHRQPVVEAAREWHAQSTPHGLARWVIRPRWAGRLDVFGSAPARGALVVVFAGALAVPLTGTLRQVAREIRVQRAVDSAEALLEVPGVTSVLARQLTFEEVGTRAHVRVATTEWVGEARRAEFERHASDLANEPIRLVLEQLPATAGNGEELGSLMGAGEEAPEPSPVVEPLPELLDRAGGRLRAAMLALPFPEGAHPVGAELELSDPQAGASVVVAYTAAEPLHPQSREVLSRALRLALGHPALEVGFRHLSSAPEPLEGEAADAGQVERLSALLERYPLLAVELVAGDSAALEDARTRLREAGFDGARLLTEIDTVPGVRVRLGPRR